MSVRARLAFCVLMLVAVLATRLPLAPDQLFSEDEVNFAWAVGKLDVRLSQPQPPGDPLFVLQLRLLHLLRFRNPRSAQLALAVAASVAALCLLWGFGNRFFGGYAGLWAALLLLLHPSFWYAGITSAVRVQLAVVSVAVAWACYRAWQGERKWAYGSAVVLGLGAGVRPELGAVLWPLWAVAAWRGCRSWRAWAGALGLYVAVVLSWLLPLAAGSGGPRAYVEACWKYLKDQAALTSPLFGAPDRLAQITVGRFVAWTFLGVLGWTLPLALIVGRQGGRRVSASQWAFLALWLLPAVAFAIAVHVADAGQTLAIVPGVCLLGGHLLARAGEEIERRPSTWHGLVWLMTMAGVALSVLGPAGTLWFTPGLALAVGWLMRYGTDEALKPSPRVQATAFLLAPAIFLNAMVFFSPGWYYKGSASRWHSLLEDFYSGLAFMSLEQVRMTTARDDHALRAIAELSREAGRPVVILWERGLLSWRKASYYHPRLPIVVLERKRLAGPAPAVAKVWSGNRLVEMIEGPPPLVIRVPPGARLIWLLNPRTEFPSLVREQFALTEASNAWYCDLPEGPGARRLGDYLLVW